MKLFGFLRMIFERQGPEKGTFLFVLSLYPQFTSQIVRLVWVCEHSYCVCVWSKWFAREHSMGLSLSLFDSVFKSGYTLHIYPLIPEPFLNFTEGKEFFTTQAETKTYVRRPAEKPGREKPAGIKRESSTITILCVGDYIFTPSHSNGIWCPSGL